MVGTGSTYVELKGKFTFAINQSGLDFKKKGVKEEAVRDFWRCWGEFMEKIRDSSFISFDYDEDDLKIEEGET